MAFTPLFDIVNSAGATPAEAPFGSPGEPIQTSLNLVSTSDGGVSLNNTIIPNPVDQLFILSPQDFSSQMSVSPSESPMSDMFNDPRKIIPTNSRDDLNFYIEIVDQNLNGLNNVDISIFGGEFVLRSLRLSVNPRVLTINSAKIISRYQTLTRWVEEHWGDELDNISIQGSTLAFILFPQSQTPGQLGLNVAQRNVTSPYQELQQIVRIYQDNGLIFQDENGDDGQTIKVPVDGSDVPEVFNTHPRLGMIKQRYYIKLSYDYGSYVGYFESFDVIEDASKPFNLSYNFNFKAEKILWK